MNIKETKLVSINPESAKVLSDLSIKTFIQAYKDVHSTADLEAWCAHNYTQQACETLLEQPNVDAVVGYQNQTPAGFYLIKHHTCPIALNGIHSELKQIYILADYYGLGLSQKLFQDALFKARSNGSNYIWLCIPKLPQDTVSELSQRFQYKAHGCRNVGYLSNTCNTVMEVL